MAKIPSLIDIQSKSSKEAQSLIDAFTLKNNSEAVLNDIKQTIFSTDPNVSLAADIILKQNHSVRLEK